MNYKINFVINNMKKKHYQIYIKSHDISPDYENECDAKNIKEASEIFWNKFVGETKWEWSPTDLIPYICLEK